MEQLYILLYSKYSHQCKKYMNMINQSADFVSKIDLKTVCIDNEEVRKRIVNSKKIGITSVPCILVVYKDGGVEKYEGGTAFEWAEELIRKFTPPLPLQPQPQPQAQPISKHPIVAYQDTTNIKKQHNVITHHQHETNNKKQHIANSKKQHHIQKSTNVEDLDTEEEEEEEKEHNKIQKDFKPPASIRSGVGNYDIKGEFGSMEEPNRNVTRGIKSSTEPGVGGKGNLMAAAMAMQKSREEPTVPAGTPLTR